MSIGTKSLNGGGASGREILDARWREGFEVPVVYRQNGAVRGAYCVGTRAPDAGWGERRAAQGLHAGGLVPADKGQANVGGCYLWCFARGRRLDGRDVED